ncbi:SOH1 family protein [Theileria parva strain Muguga]|uniref:SOH1 family protein n=1 Tax=Theileria parva strain Muguga TaxID=333668 RepID=UPI001C62143E|nr:SOH1 family protein [Theileria parva strain Muguga]KAF5153520.1 SOH1 family protein [Theileria parva strain Muguga]
MKSYLRNYYRNNSYEDNLRFGVELDFVQCLSDIYYLKHLFDKGYFNDENFRAYILYLQYWRTGHYIKFVEYAYCLKILELLLDKDFVNSLSSDLTVEALKYQIDNHWICFKHDK